MNEPDPHHAQSPCAHGCPIIYSRTCAYAIRAMARLAMLRPEGYASLHEVCEGSDLPRTFVAKIFGALVHAGLLTSAKGPGGGFALAQRPGQITLLNIVSAIDGVHHYTGCVVGLSRCDDKQPCAQHERFKPVRKQVLGYLAETTLDQMSEALVQKIGALPGPRSGPSPESLSHLSQRHHSARGLRAKRAKMAKAAKKDNQAE